jgi:hypothetical protein
MFREDRDDAAAVWELVYPDKGMSVLEVKPERIPLIECRF